MTPYTFNMGAITSFHTCPPLTAAYVKPMTSVPDKHLYMLVFNMPKPH